MKNLEILDTHGDYQYIYYDVCEELQQEYERMYGIIKANGHAIASDSWPLDAGILLRNGNDIIAGAFFNLSRSPAAILIHIIYVDDNHRRKGIYTKMHSLIDKLGKETNRTNIVSYVHMGNKIMQEHVVDKIGYKPVMQLVTRKIL